jgi:hypothetical protein
MKIGLHAGAALASLLLFSGCKNFWNVPQNPGCTTNCTPTVSSGVFYVLNSNAGQLEIAGFSIVKSALTALSGSPYPLPSGPFAIAIAPNNSFLYVSTQSGIYLYTIGTGGALTLASAQPIVPDFAGISMQVDATDSWLLEASGSGYLYAIPISPLTGKTTGTVKQLTLAGITPRQLTISPDNLNVIVALGGTGTEVIPFSASRADPLPSTASALIAAKGPGGAALSVAVDPASQLLLIGEALGSSQSSNTGVLRAFTYSSLSGTPAEVKGSPYPSGGLTPVSILPSAQGAYVYVANSTVSSSAIGNIAGFSISPSANGYSLTSLGGSTSAGTTPADLAEDSTGTVVLLVNSGGAPDLHVYTFDTTTHGKLDSALTFATGTDPVGARAIGAVP